MKYLLIFLITTLVNPVETTTSSEHQSMTIYSGNCILYKRTSAGGTKVRYSPVKEGFGKVVIGRTSKTFSFYFEGKVVHSSDKYLSSTNDRLGGEDFSLNNGYSAFRSIAERTFYVYYSPGMGDLGYEYEMQNYKVN